MKSFKELFNEEDIFDSTSSADIAQHSGNLYGNDDEDDEEVSESPVFTVGRNGAQDILDYITPAIKKEFKDLVKKIGGKTVARKLLDEMNAAGLYTNTELPDLD